MVVTHLVLSCHYTSGKIPIVVPLKTQESQSVEKNMIELVNNHQVDFATAVERSNMGILLWW